LSIYANIKSLKNTNLLFRAGSTTMVEVLNQQEKVLQAKTEYARNRHAYIMNLLKLKKAAGILCIEDLAIINSWLE
jgi:outer membrane protein